MDPSTDPMHALAPYLVGLTLTNLALTIVFAALLWSDRRRYLVAWVVAWCSYTVGNLLAVSSFVDAGLGAPALIGVLTMLSANATLIGASFYRKDAWPWRWLAAEAAAVAWSVVAGAALELPLVAITLPLFGVLGAWLLVTGARIVRLRGVGAKVAGAALLLWGLHALDFPFVAHLEWVRPWGTMVAEVLITVIGTGFILLHADGLRLESERSEARFRRFFEHAIEGIFASTLDGRFVYANAALVRMLGYADADALLALDLREDLYADPAERDRIVRGHQGCAVLRAQTRFKTASGGEIPVELVARRVGAEEGVAHAFEGFVRDLSAERALRAQAARGERMEALGRLAGGIAHDFNNLLTVVVSGVHLHRGACGVDGPDEDLDAIELAAERGMELTQQLLAFARRREERPQVLDLREVVREQARMLSRTLGEGVRVEVAPTAESACVRGDRGLMAQVLMNLAFNARDAMPSGGAVRLDTRVDGDRVVMTVADEGCGMDAETMSHIFEPFFTTRGDVGGTGLGLSSVYGLVGQMGGAIEVESAPGEGTVFTLVFPIAPAAAASAKEEHRVSASPAPFSGRLLLVDDDPHVRGTTRALLERRGFDLETAADGASALEKVLQPGADFDVVVTDVVMPGMDGVELLTRLRELRPTQPVVIVSGYAEPLTEPARLAALDAQLVPKPYTPDRLLEAIERARALAEVS
ncbi:MAG: ATP-binding protein [Myxococcota bacterium]|nr:ATP-binding protein [Myxococcota bacterium]